MRARINRPNFSQSFVFRARNSAFIRRLTHEYWKMPNVRRAAISVGRTVGVDWLRDGLARARTSTIGPYAIYRNLEYMISAVGSGRWPIHTRVHVYVRSDAAAAIRMCESVAGSDRQPQYAKAPPPPIIRKLYQWVEPGSLSLSINHVYTVRRAHSLDSSKWKTCTVCEWKIAAWNSKTNSFVNIHTGITVRMPMHQSVWIQLYLSIIVVLREE